MKDFFVIPFCTFILFFSGVCNSLSENQSANQQSKDIEIPGGVFRSEDGVEAVLCLPTNSTRWVMSFSEPEGAPMNIYMEGDPSNLKPVGFDTKLSHDEGSVDVLAEGKQMYGAGSYKGKAVEFYADESGMHSTIDGETSDMNTMPSEEIEARMMAESVADTWNQIQGARIRVKDESFDIVSAGQPMVATSALKHLTKQEQLSETQRDNFSAKVESRKDEWKRAEKFASQVREEKTHE